MRNLVTAVLALSGIGVVGLASSSPAGADGPEPCDLPNLRVLAD